MKKARIYSLLMFIVAGSLCHAQKTALQDFPEGFTPEEVGHRLAYHFVDAKHGFWGGSTNSGEGTPNISATTRYAPGMVPLCLDVQQAIRRLLT